MSAVNLFSLPRPLTPIISVMDGNMRHLHESHVREGERAAAQTFSKLSFPSKLSEAPFRTIQTALERFTFRQNTLQINVSPQCGLCGISHEFQVFVILKRWYIHQMLLSKATYMAYMRKVHAFLGNRTRDLGVASACSTLNWIKDKPPSVHQWFQEIVLPLKCF